MKSYRCFGISCCRLVENIIQNSETQPEFLIAEYSVRLTMKRKVHFWERDILKSEKALDVVERNKDSVHSAHPHLERVFQ